jgi:hypothetical protein
MNVFAELVPLPSRQKESIVNLPKSGNFKMAVLQAYRNLLRAARIAFEGSIQRPFPLFI